MYVHKLYMYIMLMLHTVWSMIEYTCTCSVGVAFWCFCRVKQEECTICSLMSVSSRGGESGLGRLFHIHIYIHMCALTPSNIFIYHWLGAHIKIQRIVQFWTVLSERWRLLTPLTSQSTLKVRVVWKHIYWLKAMLLTMCAITFISSDAAYRFYRTRCEEASVSRCG